MFLSCSDSPRFQWQWPVPLRHCTCKDQSFLCSTKCTRSKLLLVLSSLDCTNHCYYCTITAAYRYHCGCCCTASTEGAAGTAVVLVAQCTYGVALVWAVLGFERGLHQDALLPGAQLILSTENKASSSKGNDMPRKKILLSFSSIHTLPLIDPCQATKHNPKCQQQEKQTELLQD